MEKPIRILHFIPGFQFGGIESRFFDWYYSIDTDKIQFDLLIQTDANNAVFNKFKKKGGKVYQIDKISVKNFYNHIKCLKTIFYENNYLAVHSHSADKSLFLLLIAKNSGVKHRIFHARTSSFDGANYVWIRNIFKKMSVYLATDYFAVSKLSAKWLFGEDRLEETKIIKNAIEINKFRFNKEIRDKTRNKLGIDYAKVIGHVGRFTYAKNHKFILEVFKELLKEEPNSILLLIGDGPTKEEVYNKAVDYGILNKIIFLGYRENIEDYYNAMDLLLFPSFYEGFPTTILEAQASGLPCIISDSITREVGLTNLTEYIDLSKGPKYWADFIKNIDYEKNRQNNINQIIDLGYDLSKVVKDLENYYLSLINIQEGRYVNE